MTCSDGAGHTWSLQQPVDNPGKQPQRLWLITTVLSIALIVCLRTIRLGSFPDIAPDEGGWPLAVRNWVDSGKPTFDYHMAPGYHWLLGAVFRLLGSSLAVGRATSAVVSLVSLCLFYVLARRLDGHRTAWWAVLLLGTSYSAILIDRRALMEPMQIALMLGLALASTARSHGLGSHLLVVALSALLLLTKASAAYLLPVLWFASVWPPALPQPGRRATTLALALGCGVLIAAGAFWWIYRSDPATFLDAWGRDTRISTSEGDTGRTLGRFALDPVSMEHTIRWYGEHEAVLFGLAVLGLVKAIWERRQTLMAGWLCGGIAFISIQLYVQENHRVLVLPPMCFLAAWLLSRLQGESVPGGAQASPGWTGAAVFVLVAYSTLRVAFGIISPPPLETESAVAWLSARAGPDSTIVAAPYVLMRLQARPVSFFALPKPYLPSAEAAASSGAEWIVMDRAEWEHHLALEGVDGSRWRAALEACCELAYRSPGASVFKVRSVRRAASPARATGSQSRVE